MLSCFSICNVNSLKGKISNYEYVDMKARLLANMGVVEESQGNYSRGVELINKSISLCHEHSLFAQLEHGYRALASIYLRKGEDMKAFNCYTSAIEVAGNYFVSIISGERLKFKVICSKIAE